MKTIQLKAGRHSEKPNVVRGRVWGSLHEVTLPDREEHWKRH